MNVNEKPLIPRFAQYFTNEELEHDADDLIADDDLTVELMEGMIIRGFDLVDDPRRLLRTWALERNESAHSDDVNAESQALLNALEDYDDTLHCTMNRWGEIRVYAADDDSWLDDDEDDDLFD